MVEQLAQDSRFASQDGRYSIGGILSWSLRAMFEVPAGDRRPERGRGASAPHVELVGILENLGRQAPNE
jgi:hypothetical protein